ncbi:MAG TPA: DUF2029 domain-containing protein [Chloroflexi bacterium]|nr:DUF2029 domain-containing protein [Chloroflexota bacterium]
MTRAQHAPLLLLLAFRLMMLIAFLPGDLTRFGDYPYYYALARLSDDGYLPFIHYWSEHLPIFPFVSIAVYQLSRLVSGGSYEAYVYLLGGLMAACDTGSLWLFLRLAGRIRGEKWALQLGWTYGLLFVPLIFCWWTFEGMTAFSILLALYLLLEGHERGSAAVVGLGTLTKLVPVLLLPAVVRARPWRRWLPYGLMTVAVVLSVVVPLLALGGPVAVASFRSISARSSYETVWALMDGNLGTGLLGAAGDHFDLAKATTPTGNPARFPEWLKTGLFGLLYLFIFLKSDLRESPRRLVAFVCLTLVLFFLWSKGWSPQWQVSLFPLILLTLPYRWGLLFVLALSGVNLAEWPLLLSRGLNEWLYLTVPLRTGLFVLLAIELWRRVRK